MRRMATAMLLSTAVTFCIGLRFAGAQHAHEADAPEHGEKEGHSHDRAAMHGGNVTVSKEFRVEMVFMPLDSSLFVRRLAGPRAGDALAAPIGGSDGCGRVPRAQSRHGDRVLGTRSAGRWLRFSVPGSKGTNAPSLEVGTAEARRDGRFPAFRERLASGWNEVR